MRRDWRVVGSVLAFLAFAAPPAARAQSPAEDFVQQSVDRGVAVLKNKTLNETARREAFGALLSEVLDTRRMALFMLGAARNSAPSGDVDNYAEIYKAFTIASCESHWTATADKP